jgi:hypothetical protein
MAVYHTNEFSFEVPDGFVDHSINIFMTPPASSRHAPFNIIVTRDVRSEDATVSQQAATILKAVAAVPGAKVLGQRDRTVGTLAAREARLHGIQQRIPTYARQVFVGHYTTLVTITVSSQRAQSAACDALAERFLGTVRFRKQ